MSEEEFWRQVTRQIRMLRAESEELRLLRYMADEMRSLRKKLLLRPQHD